MHPNDVADIAVPQPWFMSSAVPVFKSFIDVTFSRSDDFTDAEYPWSRETVETALRMTQGSAPAAAIVLGCSNRFLRRWLTTPRYRDIPEAQRELERIARYNAIDAGERAPGTEIREQRGPYTDDDRLADFTRLQGLAHRSITCGLLASLMSRGIAAGRAHAPVYLVELYALYSQNGDVDRCSRVLDLLTTLEWIPETVGSAKSPTEAPTP